MKRFILSTLLLVLLINMAPVNSSLNLNKATFSSDLEVGTEYRWNIDNYQVADRRVESRSSPGAFEFVHGSNIDLTIDKDPSSLSLTSNEDLSDIANISQYFTLKYDDTKYGFETADQLYIWIFPPSGVNTNGERTNLITEFYVHNLYNLLRNGESFNFTSDLPDADISTDSNDEELIVNYKLDSAELQVRVDESSGVLNAVNFVSSSPNFRIEIDRRGGGSGALPVSPFWTILPLVAIPLIIRSIRRKN